MRDGTAGFIYAYPQLSHSDSCPHKACRERCEIGLIDNLKQHFHKDYIFSRLYREDSQHPTPRPNAAKAHRLRFPTDHQAALNEALEVVDLIIRGSLPRTAEQVILCIMFANAARFVSAYKNCTYREFVTRMFKVATTDTKLDLTLIFTGGRMFCRQTGSSSLSRMP